MEKFEKHIKEKLGEREIAPSSQAWDKITKELASNPRVSKKRNHRYAIAASVIGVLIAFGFLYYRHGQDETPAQVVEKDVLEKEVLKTDDAPALEKQEAEVVELNEESPIQTRIKPAEETPAFVALEEVGNINKVPLQDSTLNRVSGDIINEKASEVLKQVVLMENLNDAKITDAEVDSLLRAAQKEILTDKVFNADGKVDAMALLVEVEDELDESFRGQIFEALKEGYLKLRTSVADRNN